MARPRGIWSDKAFRDALNKAVREKHEDGRQKLVVMAEQLANAAAKGKIDAIVEVANRLDGRPQQSTDVTITDRSMVQAPPPIDDPIEWADRYTKPH